MSATHRAGATERHREALTPGRAARYAGIYATIGSILRPVRFAIAVSCTPLYSRLISRVRDSLPFRSTRPALNRTLSLVLVSLVLNVAGGPGPPHTRTQPMKLPSCLSQAHAAFSPSACGSLESSPVSPHSRRPPSATGRFAAADGDALRLPVLRCTAQGTALSATHSEPRGSSPTTQARANI